MTKSIPETSTLEEQIIQLVKTENPETLQQLLELTRERLAMDEKQALGHISRLINEGKISLKEPLKPPPKTFTQYAISSRASWFWITITLATATAITVFAVPEDAYPIVYIRYVLGSIFVLFLPGYAFVKALFPTRAPIKTSSEDLDTIVRIALAFGMSIALVVIDGLILNYTPWGIRLTPIALSLLALTVILATAALLHEHQTETSAP